MKIVGISKREFARRDGCDEKQVRRKIEDGDLAILPDGTIDPALIGTAWRRRRTNRPAKPVEVSDDYVAVDAQAREIVEASGFVIPQKAVSEAKKMAYAAAREELEYKREIGQLVPIDDVAQTVIDELSKIRSSILHLPTRAAPKVVLLKTSAQIKAVLEEEVAEVLEALTLDVKNRS